MRSLHEQGLLLQPGERCRAFAGMGAAPDTGLHGRLQLQKRSHELLHGPGPTPTGPCWSTNHLRILACPQATQSRPGWWDCQMKYCLARCACPATELPPELSQCVAVVQSMHIQTTRATAKPICPASSTTQSSQHMALYYLGDGKARLPCLQPRSTDVATKSPPVHCRACPQSTWWTARSAWPWP